VLDAGERVAMQWRILALLFLARVGLGLQFQSLGSVGDDLTLAFGFGYAEIGALIGFFMLPGLFLGLPAGTIMALTGEAMSAQSRALSMGIFFTSYFLIVGPAPAIAGWLYDRTGDTSLPILFAAALFGLTGVGNFAFRRAQRLLARS